MYPLILSSHTLLSSMYRPTSTCQISNSMVCMLAVESTKHPIMSSMTGPRSGYIHGHRCRLACSAFLVRRSLTLKRIMLVLPLSLILLQQRFSTSTMFHFTTLLASLFSFSNTASAFRTDPDSGQILCIPYPTLDLCEIRVTAYGQSEFYNNGAYDNVMIDVYDRWCNHVGDGAGQSGRKWYSSPYQGHCH